MATPQPIHAALETLYKEETLARQEKRYRDAIESYKKYFASDGKKIRIFSAPGRTEVGGNHTDHNCGKVLAASVDLDIVAVVEPLDEPVAVIKSEGFDENRILLNELDPREGGKKYRDGAAARGGKGLFRARFFGRRL